MYDFFNFGLLVFTSFFTIINPLGVMTVFMTLTAELDQKQRASTARKATIVAFFVILFFAFSGQLLFNFFKISVDSFRVVGGVIFFLMGMDMLQARLSRIKLEPPQVQKYIEDISITPLAIPLVCGPGSITNAIVMMEDAETLPLKTVLLVAVALVMLFVYIILYSAGHIIRFLGNTGNNVLMRLMGLIVMVIAVEFFFAGLKPILAR